MSRSYKKFTICKDKNSKFSKRAAVKVVRRKNDIPNGAKFKRYYCSWDICDYRSKERFYTSKEFRRNWYDKTNKDFEWLRKYYPTWKVAYRHWLRWYRMK